jgi:phage N-6-adenine-methyltransferase
MIPLHQAEGAEVQGVRTGPSMNKGKSKQDYGTPRAFIEAVQKRFGELAWDLAAVRANSVCGGCYYGPDADEPDSRDSLTADWRAVDGTLWLNPPFADIAPWAAKCASVRDRRDWTLLLVPASVGSNWYAGHVHGKAIVLPLSPRLAFNGEPFPKDLILAAYGFSVSGFEPWRWK